MGLAASQAHLDLLTLRKSDLEYQVMTISDRRLQLTKDMETLAEKKSRKLNNKVLYVIKYDEDDKNKEEKLKLSQKSLQDADLLLTDANGKKVNASSLTANQIEAGLRKGKYRLAVRNEDGSINQKEDGTGNNYVDWRTSSDLSDEYDTSDDEAATAEYDVETAKIKSKDQEFDLQQKTAETQQKAVTNEIDGVKKNIDGIIEKSFKLFA